jgi:hypothetical protein
MIKSLQLFDSYIDNPALLELSPNEAIAEEELKRKQREEQLSTSPASPVEKGEAIPQNERLHPVQEYWENMMDHPSDPT